MPLFNSSTCFSTCRVNDVTMKYHQKRKWFLQMHCHGTPHSQVLGLHYMLPYTMSNCPNHAKLPIKVHPHCWGSHHPAWWGTTHSTLWKGGCAYIHHPQGSLGITKGQLCAWQYVCWPGMNTDISVLLNLVRNANVSGLSKHIHLSHPTLCLCTFGSVCQCPHLMEMTAGFIF